MPLKHQEFVSKIAPLNFNVLDFISACFMGLSDHLQSTKINMSKAADLITATLETLQSDDVYKYVTNVNKICVTPSRLRSQ